MRTSTFLLSLPTKELARPDANCRCSLHSIEARDQMKGFIIGKVQQPWESFVPPLHGGKFRPYVEGEEEEDEKDELSEPESLGFQVTRSISPSSISSGDHSFLLDPSLRRRQGSSVASSSSSATSMTSVSIDVESSMEAWTRQGVDVDLAKYPALDMETQGKIIKQYRELDIQMRAHGLYDCNYVRYLKEITRYLAFLSAAFLLLHYGWYKTSALFLGLFWHQIAFSAHDAGHMGITHNFHIDTCFGIFLAGFCGGLSLGWWKRSHNVSGDPLTATLHWDFILSHVIGTPHHHK